MACAPRQQRTERKIASMPNLKLMFRWRFDPQRMLVF
jgi:hypothetical protein